MAILAILSFFISFADSEGGFSDSVFTIIIVGLFTAYFKVIALPSVCIGWLLGKNHFPGYFLILAITCLLYGLIIEWIIINFQSKTRAEIAENDQ
ncbi:hypothetical protein HH214_03030 [Mucilaginibacter robiniae]|uniref:Uncharacterized protein n=1 Tax=Mucilaginibacter robiniae TaxID=2728022 RepID=A0A7L5E067_9SPHI|nr:hypothetical protein [Mucilaginibacter robiniae]QJD94924.1 hypothetical protein HH214_03030 [Mucilaginibacter robiniae]